MRVWLTGDAHFGVKNNHVEWLNDMSSYFLNDLIPTIKSNYKKGDVFVFLGDLCDNRQTVGLNTLCTVQRIFNELVKVIPDIRIIVGNHDIYYKSSNDITSVDILSNIPGITIYKEPEVVKFGTKSVLMCPWRADAVEDANALKQYSGNDYVFCHMDIMGAQMQTGRLSESNLSQEEFGKSIVYSGHIHHRHSYKNINYVGCPYPLTRSDIDNVKGFWCVDLETNEKTFFENKTSPRFVKYKLDDIAAMFDDDIDEKIKNNYLDLYVNDVDINTTKVSEVMSRIEKKAKSISIYTISTNKTIYGNSDSDEQQKTLDDYLYEYVEMMEYNDNIKQHLHKMIKRYREMV